jgi:hypothetical protein
MSVYAMITVAYMMMSAIVIFGDDDEAHVALLVFEKSKEGKDLLLSVNSQRKPSISD